MNTNKIAEDIYKKSHLTKNDYFDSNVFYYISGRYPDITIEQAANVVENIRNKIMHAEA